MDGCWSLCIALFVVDDCVTLFCVCRGFRKTQKDNKSITCKQWSFMIWSEYVSVCSSYTFTHGIDQKLWRIMLEALWPLFNFVIKLALASIATFRCLMTIASIRFYCIVAEDGELVQRL